MLNLLFILAILLLLIGLLGVFLAKKNFIIILLSIELMFLAINLTLIVYSIYLDDILGEIYALLVLTIAAAESAIGLALLILYYRLKSTKMAIDFINTIKG